MRIWNWLSGRQPGNSQSSSPTTRHTDGLSSSSTHSADRVRLLGRLRHLEVEEALVTLPAHGRPPQPPGTQPIVRFYVADPIGSAIQITDNAGAVRLRRQFEPYGEVASESTADPASQEWFGGQRREERSGLFDFRARWYDSRTGGFLSQDPMIGDLADPQQHNAYAYARGNPANVTDPTGMTCEDGFGSNCNNDQWFLFVGVSIVYISNAYTDEYVSSPSSLGDYDNAIEAVSGLQINVGPFTFNFANSAPSQGRETTTYIAPNLLVAGTREFVDQTLNDLGQVLSKEPGPKLYLDLVRSGKPVTIYETSEFNATRFLVVPDRSNGVGTGALIRYNPSLWRLPGQGGIRPPFIGLAQELIHARYGAFGIHPSDHRVILGDPRAYIEGEITDNAFRRAHGIEMR